MLTGRERRDAALAEDKQDFQFSGAEDLFPTMRRITTELMGSILSSLQAAVFLRFLG